MLIGVTGYARHGKDSIGSVLESNYGFTRMGFADQLKELAQRINPIVENYAFPKHPVRLNTLVELIGWEKAKDRTPEIRRFLQELGTQARALLGGDVWIKALEHKWLDRHPMNTVITDVRFLNEADWIKRHNGYLVKVSRYEHVELDPFRAEWKLAEYTDPEHESERWVAHIKADYELLNDSTLAELQFKTHRLMDTLREGRTSD